MWYHKDETRFIQPNDKNFNESQLQRQEQKQNCQHILVLAFIGMRLANNGMHFKLNFSKITVSLYFYIFFINIFGMEKM